MDPLRVTLTSVVASALIGLAFVGTYAFVAIREYGPGEELQSGRIDVPAARDAFHQAFSAQAPAYLNDGMRMTMRMHGPGDVTIAEADARHDPATGDHSVRIRMDFKKMSEAYGFDLEEENATPDPDSPLALMNGTEFEMFTARHSHIHVLGLFGQHWAWRDYTPDDAEFNLFTSQELDAGMTMPATLSEIEPFLNDQEGVTFESVTPSTYQGTPTWLVTARFDDAEASGRGTFHFRQSDFAPLHIDVHFQGLLDSDTLNMIREEQPDFPLEDLELRMVITFHYGQVQIELPTDTTRVGVTVEAERTTAPTRHELRISSEQDQVVPLVDLALHVVIADPGFFGPPTVHQVLAKHDLKNGLTGQHAGHTFTYQDHDNDGQLSPGDIIIVQNDNGFWSNDTHTATILIYDHWAGQYEGAPGPMPFLVVLIIGLGIGLLRRATRRRE
jgi:hypothetical protein